MYYSSTFLSDIILTEKPGYFNEYQNMAKIVSIQSWLFSVLRVKVTAKVFQKMP